LAHLLSESLDTKHTVSNASISGETTSGGRARFELSLKEFNPDVVLLELGANDGLQGLSLDHMRDNLAAMIELSKKSGAEVALAGISFVQPGFIQADGLHPTPITQPLIRDLVLEFLNQSNLLN